jgi:NAD(P)-dependent dehydrogenase (short-subunit alcohol dehydrogenase family)
VRRHLQSFTAAAIVEPPSRFEAHAVRSEKAEALDAIQVPNEAGPVTEQSAESYAAIFDTNVLGRVLSMKHELRVMQTQRHGSIVNLSSTLRPINYFSLQKTHPMSHSRAYSSINDMRLYGLRNGDSKITLGWRAYC